MRAKLLKKVTSWFSDRVEGWEQAIQSWALIAPYVQYGAILQILARISPNISTNLAMSSRNKGVLYSAKNVPYVPAKLVESKGKHGWYIEYWVWHVEIEKLVRKRYYHIAGTSLKEKRKNGRAHCQKINTSLAKGASVGKAPTLPHKPPPSFGEVFRKGVNIKDGETSSERSRQNYRYYSNIITYWFDTSKLGRKKVDQFSRKDVYAFLDYLTETRKVGPKTRNNYHEYFSNICNVLVERGLLKENPAQGITKLKTQGRRHVPFTPSQRAILENWMKIHDPELYQFTRLVYYCFLRPVEILRIRISQIDLPNRIILVWAGNAKNRKQMPVVIPGSLASLLTEMKIPSLPDAWYLFGKGLRPGENSWHRNRVSERHRAALEACEMDTAIHDLYGWKHTGVCNAYRAGVDIQAIQTQCRHFSLNETEIYLRSLGLRISSELKNTDW